MDTRLASVRHWAYVHRFSSWLRPVVVRMRGIQQLAHEHFFRSKIIRLTAVTSM